MFLVLFILILIAIYCQTLIWLLVGFSRLSRVKEQSGKDLSSFTVIIPFRNEEERILPLLESLLNLEYETALVEIILVDDASKDNSVEMIEQKLGLSGLNWKIISNERHSGSPKKDAITAGIKAAKNDWIITTDADCSLPTGWLRHYDSKIRENKTVMICGPVSFYTKGESSLAAHYQMIEGIGLQGVTMGGFGLKRPLLCNGANLAFKKEVFEQVGGYAGNSDIASGDDIFLMDKIRKRYRGKIGFLKDSNAIVRTPVMSNWKGALQQRIRWASKTSRQKNGLSKFIASIIFITNILVVLCCIGIPALNWQFYHLLLMVTLGKIGIDLFFLFWANMFFKIKLNIGLTLLISVVYPFIFSFIAIRSVFGRYQWKGRDFRR